MATAAPRAAPSGALASRELNGEVLLEELGELRQAQVPQRDLNDMALAARELGGMRVPEAQARLKALASGRFVTQPPLAGLLVRWGQKLRTEADVGALASHLERLALTSSIVSVLRRGQAKLKRAR